MQRPALLQNLYTSHNRLDMGRYENFHLLMVLFFPCVLSLCSFPVLFLPCGVLCCTVQCCINCVFFCSILYCAGFCKFVSVFTRVDGIPTEGASCSLINLNLSKAFISRISYLFVSSTLIRIQLNLPCTLTYCIAQ